MPRTYARIAFPLIAAVAWGELGPLEQACDALAATYGDIPGVSDSDPERSCRSWAAAGQCDENPGYMHEHCQLSCLRRLCMDADYVPQHASGSSAGGSVLHGTGGDGALASTVRRALAAYVPTQAADTSCASGSSEEFARDEIVSRVVQTLQSGIPADAGCALDADSVVREIVDGVGGAICSRPPPTPPDLELSCADVRSESLTNTTHVYMHPICFSRPLMRDAMAAVGDASSLRCLVSFRKAVELRLLNATGLSLMCSVTNLPPTFTSRTALFVYAKASSVTMQRVWPVNVPECDRSDVEVSAAHE